MSHRPSARFTSLARWALVSVGAAAATNIALAQSAPATSAASLTPVAYRHGGGGMAGARALDAIGATADQKARIRTIYMQAASGSKADRAQSQALRTQMSRLLTASSIDAGAVESTRQQMLALQDSMSKRRTQARMDAAAVLTPDQRAKLSVRIAQRQELMQRQRKEREALDASMRS